MRLSTRLTIAMVALVLFTATAIGLLTSRNVAAIAMPRTLDRLDVHARFLGLDLESSQRDVPTTVLAVAAAVRLDGLIRARAGDGVDPVGGLTEAAWRAYVAERYVAVTRPRSEYLQMRLIGVDDGGRELVRVERAGPDDAIRIVPDNELERRGEKDYFRQTIGLAAGDLYVSPIELSEENPDAKPSRIPMLRVATPVHGPDGGVFGLMIATIDMRAVFARVRSGALRGAQVFVVNAAGDYLVHPDAAKEFGFASGQRARIQDDLPEFAPLLAASDTTPHVVTDRAGERLGVGWNTVRIAGGPPITVVETVPYSFLIAAAALILKASLLGGLAAVLVAILLAVVLARSLTRPLVQVTNAVAAFGRDETMAVPTDAGGEVGVLARAFVGMATHVRDHTATLRKEIEERKRAEAELRRFAEREQLFIAAVESSDDAIVTKTLDGTITGWNSGAARLFGYKAGEAIGQPIDFIVPAELRADVHAMLDKIASGEKIEHHETVRVSKDGRRIDVSLSISPVKSTSGAIIGAAKVARDITGKNKARQALLESEQMARGIIDTALDAFIQMDESGTVIDWSPKAETMFGWSRQEAVGRKIGDLVVVPEHRAEHSARLAQFLKDADGGTPGRRYEAPSLRRDGKVIDNEISLTALRRRGGYVINGFLRDVTARKAGEEQMRQAQKMEAVGQLTGGIAHDFNNMLTVITGTIDILAAEVADKPEMAAIATLISEAADRGAELTNRLLAFARKQPLQPKQTDINALLADIVRLLRPALGEHVEIEQRLQPAAWHALIDPGQLTTAILNLGVNARDAMPDGGKLTLETGNVVLDENYAGTNTGVEAGEYVMIAVSDTGDGIPEAVRERVFEPFFSTKEGKGTGLGLSMVYGFVKQSGGHVKIYSEVGHGTTIKLYLPRVAASTDRGPDEQRAAPIERGSETILIVEDDAMVRNFVIAQIESLGYRTLSAANAAEALALIENGARFDLLFTDVMMPGQMNGRQLAEEAAKRRSSLRVLFTSGYTENAMIHHGRLDAGVHLLAKPYRRAELARMLRVALDAVPELTPS